MKTSTAAWIVLGATCASGLSCGLFFPEPGPRDSQELTTGTADSGAAAVSAEPERNDLSIIQGRFSIGPSSGPATTFVDIEVQGLRKQATAVCDQLMRADMSMVAPDGVDLQARMVRPCSGEALPEPEASTRLALVQVEHLDAVELLVRLANASKEDLQSIHVRRRLLSGYKDESSCQEALARQQAAQLLADEKAQQAARKWLEAAIKDQDKAASDACRKGASSKTCEQAKQLARMLKDRQSRSSTEPPADRSNRSVVCRLR